MSSKIPISKRTELLFDDKFIVDARTSLLGTARMHIWNVYVYFQCLDNSVIRKHAEK